MCLIIAKKGAIEKPIPEEYILNAASNNPHGFGIVGMPPPGSDAKVVAPIHIKTMNMDQAVFYIRQYESLHWDFIAHFRMATAGEKNVENCHPFEIGPDVYLAHNGVISITRRQQQYSDTWEWAQQMKAFVEAESPSLTPLNRKNIRAFFGQIPRNRGMTKDSKFAVIGKGVPLTVINPKDGKYIDGIWYSNPNTIKWGQRSCATRQTFTNGSWNYSGPDPKTLRTANEFKDDDVLLKANRRHAWLSNDIELGTATPWLLTGIPRSDFMIYFDRFPEEIAAIFTKAAEQKVEANKRTKEYEERRKKNVSQYGQWSEKKPNGHYNYCRCVTCEYDEQQGVTREINFTTTAGTRVRANVRGGNLTGAAKVGEAGSVGAKPIKMRDPLPFVPPKSLYLLKGQDATVQEALGRIEVCH